MCLLIGLLRVEEQQVVYGAELELLACDVETVGSRTFGRELCADGVRIGLERPQGVRDILECRKHRAPILRRRLFIGRHRRTPEMDKLATAEERLRQSGGGAPDGDPRQRVACGDGAI